MQLRRGAVVLRGRIAAQSCVLCRSPPASLDPSRIRRAGLHSSPRRDSAWAAAVQVASNVVGNVVKRAADDGMTIDPLRAVAKEMQFLTGNIRKLLGSGHPSLDRVAKYYTQAQGKHVRPLIVLLMSRATHLCPKNPRPDLPQNGAIDTPISPVQILADVNPSAAPLTARDPGMPEGSLDILPSQRRLAEITELIHTASLLHDDVIDHSVSRRGSPSANLEFGNKMAVLAGDFLLGRASVALARLRHVEVVELLATVIANLVEGEFMQLKNTERDERSPEWSEETLGYYLQKTYLKTASLISKSCRASALLGNADNTTVDAAYSYGRNLGLAFQLVDDMLDYTRSGADLGKPAGADLKLGLATAPLLFAWKQNPELGALVGRKFEQEGDVEKARELVLQSDGIEQTRALAHDYSDKAIAAIADFPDSEAKDGLVEMAQKTIRRQK
ncbi:polyprenyl synthetase domain-containing protein [Hirsutella rhossiliensis]|uniref:Polyprenyl synthetase domain-containing protein n=1 Tax=Hirsutella rhossiliensis TaxID=111463 RepID=A0A9P8MS98_9HYPO|nr:polyprenyl synthetase domain-containing protein [Hirsutella rhossiliensis]KAH0958287.1 polyprenyl synthetase domain-containing protein [Hirsutella rhossiliensis]